MVRWMGASALALALLLARSDNAARAEPRPLNASEDFRILDAPDQRLNVLFVIVDDLRPETGSYGSANTRTPNFDRLAAQSVQFDRAYSQQALCGPSRGSFLTGRLPSSLNYFVHTNPEQERDILDASLVLPKYFERQGYEVHGTSKLVHWVTNNKRYVERYVNQPVLGDNVACGAKVVCDDDADERDLTDARALAFAKRRLTSFARGAGARTADGKPWMLMVGFRRPHTKFRAPRRVFERLDAARVSLPEFSERGIPASAPWQAHREMCTDLLWSAEVERSGFRSGVSAMLQDGATRELRRGYFACVEWIDELLGELLDHVDSEGLADSTLLVVTSDHGWQLGEHGSWCKGTVYDRALQVPLWIRDPASVNDNGNAGRRVSEVVQLVDLYATVAELAGVPMTAHDMNAQRIDGRSLAHLVRPDTPTSDVVNDALLHRGSLGGRPWSWPESAAFSFWPVCTMTPGSRQQVNCKACVDEDTNREVECSDCADGIVRRCGQEVRRIAFMGLSVRTQQYRYNLWVPWNNDKEIPDWTGPGDWGSDFRDADTREFTADELYAHEAAPGGVGGTEVENVVSDPALAAVRAKHHAMLRARFVSCDGGSATQCSAHGAHCAFLRGRCVDRGFCGFQGPFAEADCRARGEACVWNAVSRTCQSDLGGLGTRQIVRPTQEPTRKPTRAPLPMPSRAPTQYPTTSRPTHFPTTPRPTSYPTTPRPTSLPTTPRPTAQPTTERPSAAPVAQPARTSKFCRRQKWWTCEHQRCRRARGIGCRAMDFCGYGNRFTEGARDGCNSNPDFCVWDVVVNSCVRIVGT